MTETWSEESDNAKVCDGTSTKNPLTKNTPSEIDANDPVEVASTSTQLKNSCPTSNPIFVPVAVNAVCNNNVSPSIKVLFSKLFPPSSR